MQQRIATSCRSASWQTIGVRVLEIAQPWVRTDLMNSREVELAMLLGTDADRPPLA